MVDSAAFERSDQTVAPKVGCQNVEKFLFGPSGQIWRKSAGAVGEGDNDGPILLKVVDHAFVSDQKLRMFQRRLPERLGLVSGTFAATVPHLEPAQKERQRSGESPSQ